MESKPDTLEDRRGRVAAAAEIVAFALERNLLHLALGAAREAARSALLALAAAPRRLSGPDLGLLREVATAPPQHLAGRPAERAAMMRTMLSAVDRLFPPPQATEGHGRPQDGSAGRPPLRGPDRAHRAGMRPGHASAAHRSHEVPVTRPQAQPDLENR